MEGQRKNFEIDFPSTEGWIFLSRRGGGVRLHGKSKATSEPRRESRAKKKTFAEQRADYTSDPWLRLNHEEEIIEERWATGPPSKIMRSLASRLSLVLAGWISREADTNPVNR